jgi:hypothetical protein
VPPLQKQICFSCIGRQQLNVMNIRLEAQIHCVGTVNSVRRFYKIIVKAVTTSYISVCLPVSLSMSNTFTPIARIFMEICAGEIY